VGICVIYVTDTLYKLSAFRDFGTQFMVLTSAFCTLKPPLDLTALLRIITLRRDGIDAPHTQIPFKSADTVAPLLVPACINQTECLDPYLTRLYGRYTYFTSLCTFNDCYGVVRGFLSKFTDHQERRGSSSRHRPRIRSPGAPHSRANRHAPVRGYAFVRPDLHRLRFFCFFGFGLASPPQTP
jgi:hypothetical protein